MSSPSTTKQVYIVKYLYIYSVFGISNFWLICSWLPNTYSTCHSCNKVQYNIMLVFINYYWPANTVHVLYYATRAHFQTFQTLNPYAHFQTLRVHCQGQLVRQQPCTYDSWGHVFFEKKLHIVHNCVKVNNSLEILLCTFHFSWTSNWERPQKLQFLHLQITSCCCKHKK